MEGKVKLQMVVATFGSSALGKFKVGYLNMGTSEVLSSKSSHRDDFMHLIASIWKICRGQKMRGVQFIPRGVISAQDRGVLILIATRGGCPVHPPTCPPVSRVESQPIQINVANLSPFWKQLLLDNHYLHITLHLLVKIFSQKGHCKG